MSDPEKRPIIRRDDGRSYGSVVKANESHSSEASSSSSTDPNTSAISTSASAQMRSTLTIFEKLGYGLGHVYNDLCAGVWFSYTILFMQNALGMAGAVAGTLVMIGQVGDAIATPIVGKLSDKYGTKRRWHMFGTLLVFLSFPLIFSLCPWCKTAPPWWQPTYFTMTVLVFQLGWAIVQITHLAMIPEIARTQRDRMDLTAIRYSASVFSSVVVYVVMWVVLSAGSTTQAHIVPADAYKFRDVSLILTLFGVSMAVCFHFSLSVTGYGSRRQQALDSSTIPSPPISSRSASSNIDEETAPIIPSQTQQSTPIPRKNFFRSPLLYQNAFLYVFSRLFCTTALVYIPLWLDERSWTPASSLTALPNRVLDLDSVAAMPVAEDSDNTISVAHIAIIPLISFLSSFVASIAMKFMNRLFGPKMAYLFGSVTSISGCLWVALAAPSNASSYELGMIAVLFGAGSSITMISSLCITADMIGKHVDQSGFIYSAVTFADKLITGVVVFLIETLKCNQRSECPEYYQHVLAYGCGIAACLGLFTLTTLQCNRRRRPLRIAVPRP